MADDQIRVLLVDDDEDEHVIIRDMLSSLGTQNIELDWVATYEAGLDSIRRRLHDAYLLDFRLGGHSGLELLREAVGDGCKAPIILLTGQGDHDVDVEAMRAGAADYLVKGQVDAALLERSLRFALERSRSTGNREATRTTPRPGDLVLQMALARGASIPEAARTAGISDRTAYRRVADPDFSKEVDRLRDQLRSKLVDEVAHQLLADDLVHQPPNPGGDGA
ncbi:MAG: response regulator [Acidimicrobiia bacterium]